EGHGARVHGSGGEVPPKYARPRERTEIGAGQRSAREDPNRPDQASLNRRASHETGAAHPVEVGSSEARAVGGVRRIVAETVVAEAIVARRDERESGTPSRPPRGRLRVRDDEPAAPGTRAGVQAQRRVT